MRFRSLGVTFGLIGFACGSGSPALPDYVDQACQQVAACGASPFEGSIQPGSDCVETVSDQYDEAAAAGCASPFTDLISCYATAPAVCAGTGPGSCEAAEAALAQCPARAAAEPTHA